MADCLRRPRWLLECSCVLSAALVAAVTPVLPDHYYRSRHQCCGLDVGDDVVKMTSGGYLRKCVCVA